MVDAAPGEFCGEVRLGELPPLTPLCKEGIQAVIESSVETQCQLRDIIAHVTFAPSAVKTCWLRVELILRHELMEAFLYKGVRIFNPHHTVAELSMPARVLEGGIP